jgi:hypothetical protein
MIPGKFFNRVNAPLGKINFSGAADINICIRQAKGLFGKVQFSLVNTAKNQNHSNLLKNRHHCHGAKFAQSQSIAGNIAVHAIQGLVGLSQSSAIACQTAQKHKAVFSAKQESACCCTQNANAIAQVAATLNRVTAVVIPNTSICPGWGNVTITPATAAAAA